MAISSKSGASNPGATRPALRACRRHRSAAALAHPGHPLVDADRSTTAGAREGHCEATWLIDGTGAPPSSNFVPRIASPVAGDTL